jgi:ABC-type transport system involved in cytochrome bd biosynthesis fused ATPase/permease subunit
VKAANQILVLQDGRIVERGRHETLIRRDGLYRQIYDLELRDQEEALEKVRREETERTGASAASEGVKG